MQLSGIHLAMQKWIPAKNMREWQGYANISSATNSEPLHIFRALYGHNKNPGKQWFIFRTNAQEGNYQIITCWKMGGKDGKKANFTWLAGTSTKVFLGPGFVKIRWFSAPYIEE